MAPPRGFHRRNATVPKSRRIWTSDATTPRQVQLLRGLNHARSAASRSRCAAFGRHRRLRFELLELRYRRRGSDLELGRADRLVRRKPHIGRIFLVRRRDRLERLELGFGSAGQLQLGRKLRQLQLGRKLRRLQLGRKLRQLQLGRKLRQLQLGKRNMRRRSSSIVRRHDQ